MSTPARPCASLSLDLDNEWCFMQTNGDAGWEHHPSYLDRIVPRMLAFLARRNLRITFFIVGQDAALPVNREALASIARAGHEIGNHSFGHQPWLHEYSLEQLNDELARAEDAIEAATGVRPNAFRGPGYSYSADVLRALSARGYDFDASSFPNSVSSLARLYLFSRNRLGASDKGRRKALFGTTAEALRPIDPYQWQTAERPLLEIPVTTMPLLRVPIHFSYVLYLGSFAPWLATAYFRAAVKLCRWTGVEPSMLFHPLDFMGNDDHCPSVAFFPGMDVPAQFKIDLLDRCMNIMANDFELVTMHEHARRIRQRGTLPSHPLPAPV